MPPRGEDLRHYHQRGLRAGRVAEVERREHGEEHAAALFQVVPTHAAFRCRSRRDGGAHSCVRGHMPIQLSTRANVAVLTACPRSTFRNAVALTRPPGGDSIREPGADAADVLAKREALRGQPPSGPGALFSFDHLVGAQQHRQRDREPKCLRRLSSPPSLSS